MTMANRLKSYLKNQGVDYQVMFHSHTHSSMATAEAAHIPGNRLAKAVIVGDDGGYLMVVLPSAFHVEMGTLHKQLDRPLGLVTEAELRDLFPDCELGAIPAVGAAYGLDAVLDEALADQPEIYFEGGDHETVICVSGEQYRKLLKGARLGRFGHTL